MLTRRRDRTWQDRAAVLVLLAAIAVPRVLSAAGADNGRILIYLEVPRVVEAATEVILEGITLAREDGTGVTRLEPRRASLASSDLAGQQTLIVSAEIPPGVYTTLNLQISSIRGQVGVASVTPAPPPDGVPVAVDFELRPAEAETVFLEWRPAGIDGEAEFHTPDIRQKPVTLPPLGSLALATSRGSGTVMLIDRAAGRVVGARWVDDDPRGIAYSEVEQMFYVAFAGQDAIGAIEALSLRLMNVVPLQFGDAPSRLLVSHDRLLLFVLSPGSRTLTAMSVRSLQQQFRIPVGEGPRSLAQDPVSGRVYVACEDEGVVQVIDPGLGSVVTSLTLAPAPQEVVIDPFTRSLFVGGAVQRRVYQLNLSGEEVVTGGQIDVCGSVLGMAYNPKTLRLYAGIPRCQSLAVVRPEMGIEFASVPLPEDPGLMAFDKEFRQLFVVLPRAGAVAIVNPNSGLMETLVDVGERPFAVVVP